MNIRVRKGESSFKISKMRLKETDTQTQALNIIIQP